MIKESLRLFAVLLLIIIIIADDFPFYNKMKDPGTQFFIAILFVSFIYYDTTFGFIMGLVLMLIYYEIYKKLKNNKTDYLPIAEVEKPLSCALPKPNISCTQEMDYVSEELLVAAQNNIFSEENYDVEVKGVEVGFHNEKVYGVQGLDVEKLNYQGYSKDDKYYSYS